MPTEKISLTLDETLVASARQLVGRRGLSSYINEALRRRLQRDRVSSLLEQLEAQHGPVPQEVVDEVRETWPDPISQARSA